MKIKVSYDTESDGEVLELDADDLVAMGYTPIEVVCHDEGCDAIYEVPKVQKNAFMNWIEEESNWCFFGITAE